MSIKISIISSLLIFNFAFAQSVTKPDSLTRVVGQIVRDAIQDDKIKDSTALYSFSITIDVSLKKGEQAVDLMMNNLGLSSKLDFKKLEKLKMINYGSLMKNTKKAIFSFKVYMVVYDSKYEPHLVPIEEASKAIRHLFLKDEFKIVNLGSMLIEFDKKIYN